MGRATILFRNAASLECTRGDSLSDREAADALLTEVARKRNAADCFVH